MQRPRKRHGDALPPSCLPNLRDGRVCHFTLGGAAQSSAIRLAHSPELAVAVRATRSIREHLRLLPAACQAARPVLERSAGVWRRHCGPARRGLLSTSDEDRPLRPPRRREAGADRCRGHAARSLEARAGHHARAAHAGRAGAAAPGQGRAAAGGAGAPAPRLPAGRHRQDGLHRTELHRPRRGGRARRCRRSRPSSSRRRAPSAGPSDPIVRPRGAAKLDYEVRAGRGDRPRSAHTSRRPGAPARGRLLHRQRRLRARVPDGARRHHHQGQERRHLRAGRPVARDRRRGRRSAGPRALDHRQRRAPPERQHAPA